MTSRTQIHAVWLHAFSWSGVIEVTTLEAHLRDQMTLSRESMRGLVPKTKCDSIDPNPHDDFFPFAPCGRSHFERTEKNWKAKLNRHTADPCPRVPKKRARTGVSAEPFSIGQIGNVGASLGLNWNDFTPCSTCINNSQSPEGNALISVLGGPWTGKIYSDFFPRQRRIWITQRNYTIVTLTRAFTALTSIAILGKGSDSLLELGAREVLMNLLIQS